MTKLQVINDLCSVHAEMKKLERDSDMWRACAKEERRLTAILHEMLEEERAANLLVANSG